MNNFDNSKETQLNRIASTIRNTAIKQPSDNRFYIKRSDIDCYLRFTKRVNPNIKTIDDPAGNSVLYIINYTNGWEIIAADKRAPVPLAYGNSGEFSLSDSNPMMSWIHILAEDVQHSLTNEEINDKCKDLVDFNSFYWKLLTSEPASIDSIARILCGDPSQTRAFVGRYVLIDVDITYEECDSIPHLISTYWSQDANDCNAYCPFKEPNQNERIQAGCVAVAGAQMLYFLHNKIGLPLYSPSVAWCNSWIDEEPLDMWQGYPTDTLWQYMSPVGDTIAAKLIAQVAQRVGTQFYKDTNGEYHASASLSTLKDSCFLPENIDCTFRTYDDSLAKNSLLDSIPVMVRADSAESTDVGHAFIIDGFIRKREVMTAYFMWEWLNYDPHDEYPKMPFRVEYTYGKPYISYFLMNWGWGNNPDYVNARFSPSGDWIPKDNSNYTNNRKMIYGFEPVD